MRKKEGEKEEKNKKRRRKRVRRRKGSEEDNIEKSRTSLVSWTMQGPLKTLLKQKKVVEDRSTFNHRTSEQAFLSCVCDLASFSCSGFHSHFC